MSDNEPWTQTNIRPLMKMIDATVSDMAYRLAGREVPDADELTRGGNA